MAILQYANSITEFFEGDDTGGAIDHDNGKAPYTRKSTLMYRSTPLAYINWESTPEVWITFYMRGYLDDNYGSIVVVYGDDDSVFFRMEKVNNSVTNIDFEYNDGNSYTDFKSSWGHTNWYTTVRWDMRFKVDAVDGGVSIYKNGFLDAEYLPGDTTNGGARTGLNSFRIGSFAGAEGWYTISALIVADEPTLNMQYLQTWPAADGTYTEWGNGDFTAIDETGIDDTDSLKSEDTDTRYTYTLPTLTNNFDIGHKVVAVCQTVRADKKNVDGKNFRHMVRSGTTDDFSQKEELSLIKKPYKQIFTVNPATGSPWTISEAKAAELGFQIRI